MPTLRRTGLKEDKKVVKPFLEYPKMVYMWPRNSQAIAYTEEQYNHLKSLGYKDNVYLKPAE